MFKKMLTFIGIFWLIILGGTLVLTILNYFNLFSSSIISVLKLLLPITAIFIVSYRLGKLSEKKGYLEGLKIGSVIVLLFLILVLLLDKFMVKSLLYYLILILSSVMGSMIGINKRK